MLKLSHRLFLAVVGCVGLGGGACGGDDTVPLEPVSYELSVTGYNGRSDVLTPHCDGTIAVAVRISPDNSFSLRPANACGTSTRCGYVRFELIQSGQVVSTTESATLQGVVRLPDVTESEGLQLRVSLRSGVDRKPILNADGEEAIVTVTPDVRLPEGCDDSGMGGAGGVGAGGAGGEGGAAGAGGAGAEAAAGAGGAGDAGGAGGAGGDSSESPMAGAGGG